MEIGIGWKNLEEETRKSLWCCDWSVKGDPSECSEEENYRESMELLRDNFKRFRSNSGRNMDGKGHSDEVSDGNKEHSVRNGSKG